MKRLTAVLLSLLMILSAVSAFSFVVSADDETTGQIGDNVFWEVDKTSRMLRIKGTGEMSKMPSDGQPWRYKRDYIYYVTIAEGVTYISAGAFSDLPKLQTVIIPSTVEIIEGSAFTSCPNLVEFKVASGNKYYLANDVNSTDGVLYTIDKSELVRFPSQCVLLKDSVTTVKIPETVTAIGSYAFEGNTKLTTVTFEKTGQLEYIGEYAFAKCTALKSLDFSQQPDLTSIGTGAFSGCTALKEFKVWNTLRKSSIGEGIFNGCPTFSNFNFYGTKAEFGNLNIQLPGTSLENAHFHNTDTLIKAYFIKYDPNGGTIGKEFEIEFNGASSKISDLEPINEKGTFVGWSTNPNATAAMPEYEAGKEYNASKGNLYLYAVYNTTMQLKFDANGGTGAPSAITFEKKCNLTIPTVVPTRSGYEFLGWSKSKDATNAAFSAGGTITVDSSVTLYAVWNSTGPYDITYYNGSTLVAKDVAVKQKNVDYKITRTTSKEPASRYEFLGWSKTEGGSVDYAVGSTLKENTNVILYAVFKDNGPYDIYFHTDIYDPDYTVKVSQSSKGASVTINVSPVSYSDYEFLGWSDNYYADYAKYVNGATITPTSDLHLYPYIKRINHTEGTTFSLKSQTVTVDYRNNLEIIADAYNVPSGYGIAVFDGRKSISFAYADSTGHAHLEVGLGETTESASYTVKVTKSGASAGETFMDSNGKPLTAKINVEVKTNLLLKIIAFFRSIFSAQPTTKVQ